MKAKLKQLMQDELISFMTVTEINSVVDKVYDLAYKFEFVDDNEMWRKTYPRYVKEVQKAKMDLLKNHKLIAEIYKFSPLIDLYETLDLIQKKALNTKRTYEKLRIEDVNFETLFSDYIFKNQYNVLNIAKMSERVVGIMREICWCKDTDLCSNVCSKCNNLELLRQYLIEQYERRYKRNSTEV